MDKRSSSSVCRHGADGEGSTAARHQSPLEVIMIRPLNFGYDDQTAASNAFQHRPTSLTGGDLRAAARLEFDGVVASLLRAGVRARVFEDRRDPECPDAVFPNNWFSTHGDSGVVVVYPMFCPTRRKEPREDILQHLKKNHKAQILDYSSQTTGADGSVRALEGTGSIVFDYLHKRAYACRSPRTDEALLRLVCARLGYAPVVFSSRDRDGQLIYHTNVMMWIGTPAAGICLDSITDPEERKNVEYNLNTTGRDVINLSQEEIEHFAGNCLEVRSVDEAASSSSSSSSAFKQHLVLSSNAMSALTANHRRRVEAAFDSLIVVDIPNIEKIGGGGVRCMLASNHFVES